jgi:ubiquinone/menaquinone biosynthesis C-methylase UbiE
MVRIVWDRYQDNANMLPAKIDIQNIPFPDNCFDVVIANYMLYHVPDLDAAL